MTERRQSTSGQPAAEIVDRRDWVHDRAGHHRWKRGLIGSSDKVRERLTRSRGDRRSGAWFDRRWSSRTLHRVGQVTSHAGAGLVVALAVLLWLVLGWVKSFPTWWQATLYATSSSITLVMVFAIQHTQARQQAAVQRKLDEMLRAMGTASDSLIAVEEAPDEELQALADLNIKDRDWSGPRSQA